MKIRTLTVIAVLAACQPAIAELEIVTQVRAVEMSLPNMILPESTNGMMTYRPCAGECEKKYNRARLTAETAFSVDGLSVRFAVFRTEFAAIRNAKDSYALLSVDTKTRTVTRIDIAR